MIWGCLGEMNLEYFGNDFGMILGCFEDDVGMFFGDEFGMIFGMDFGVMIRMNLNDVGMCWG